ncbi:protein DpdE [Candidatus Poriferisodalis sp.]|uniref:protein DpdE n=1 Tax=Candidatus Poriferisodalis sp. TaxID=3101277 RepID=UPI003B530529
MEKKTVGALVDTGMPYGIGRVTAIDPECANVQFFKGPSQHPYVSRSIEWAAIESASLMPHTRVYLRDDVRWKIGRIDSEHPDRDGRYAISFPRQEGAILSVEDFEVRWLQPVDDPFEWLAVLGGDNPVIYRSRVDLIARWQRQSAAARGVEDLFLSSAELHDHQMTVVRTVSADMTRRYLLADEVGLGKTIEAGALIARCVRAEPRQSVLVLAPEHLREQWASELSSKFHLEAGLRSTVMIGAHDDWSAWPHSGVHMLVVDEAHRLTRQAGGSGERFSRLRELAHGAASVLLLSATPVRSNEIAFLDLLNLLDPANYALDDSESFVQRVRMRDQVALMYQALAYELDSFDVSLYAEQLTKMLPHDAALGALAQRAVKCADGERSPAVRRLRDHLSQTYRLHHRLLRTRRSRKIEEHFEVRGRWCAESFVLEVPDETDRLRGSLADGFRIFLAEQAESGLIDKAQAAAAFASMAEACGAPPTALLKLAGAARSPTQVSPDSLLGAWLSTQGDHWRRELQAYEPAVVDRLAVALDRLAVSKDRGKVVAVSSFSSVANAVADALVRRRGGHRVAVHLDHQSRAEQFEAVERWRSQPHCRVLVCDSSAEEGINLQAASVVVHLDLPWQAFRAEQRIGRCDRFVTVNDLPVESVVVMYGEQALARNWLVHLRDVCGVFDQSVSSLQYALADEEASMLQRVLRDGADALTADASERKQALAEESRRIAAHDSLDAAVGEHGHVNRLVRSADADRTMTSALTTWLEGVGARLTRPHEGTLRIARKPRLQVPFEVERAMAQWYGEELALTRAAAVCHHRPIVRAGHRLLDAIVEHLRRTDRGVSFAFWRPASGVWPPVPLLRTDFLVRAGDNARLRDVAAEDGLANWLTATVEAAMPPVVEGVVVRVDGAEMTDAEGTRPFSHTRGDRNLMSDPERFAALTAHLDWGTICSRGLEHARAVLQRRSTFSDVPIVAAAAVSEAVEDRLTVVRARTAAGHSGVASQCAGFERLASAVPERLEVVGDVLGCGVILCGDAIRMRSVGA